MTGSGKERGLLGKLVDVTDAEEEDAEEAMVDLLACCWRKACLSLLPVPCRVVRRRGRK
jgi:hypothetical protein